MLKIIVFAIVLAAIALSGAVSVAYFESTVLPSQHAQDDIQANEADAPPIKATADVSFGDAPLLTLSRLPNLNETAIVEITYTNTVGADLVDPELFSAGTTNWDLSTEFEIVNAGGLEYEILGSDARSYPGYTVYSAFVPLRADESITYRLEIRAVAEGPARIAATYLGGAEINLYIDAEETLLLRDYAKKHPELYTMPQPVVPKSDTARYITEEDLKDAPTTVGQPTREETMDTFTKYPKNSGDTVEWAVESLLQTGILNATELRTVLANVGFTEDEISEGMQSAASAETVPSPLQQVRDGVPIGEIACSENRVLILSPSGIPACVFEESVLELETRGFEFIGEPFDMFPINSSDMADSTLWTGDPPPVITMSRLPNIGETAIVEINFTNAVWGDVTDTERYRNKYFETGWKVSSEFEIVDSGGLKYETRYFYGTNEIADYRYSEFTPLNPGESKTYRIEVRAVEEGKSAVSAYGYETTEAAIVVYLDDEETMLTQDHMARYPEMHERTARTVSDNGREPKPLTDEEIRALEQNVRELTHEELVEFITTYVRDEQPSIEWALDNLLLPFGPLNMTEVRQVLSDAGYTDAEIDDALSQHPFTQPSDMSGLDGDGDAAYTIPSSVADASNAFALNFYRQVSGDDENIFFSPISMYTAFSVLYEGAEGDTAVQIRDAFGLEEHPTARHKAVSDTMSSLNRNDPYATVEMANSLWIADRFEPYDSYINTARNTYLASVEIVDFLDKTEDGAVDRINAWASEKTHGKIPQVLLHDDVNERTVATILNAIYFKGSWVTEFPKDATHESDFWTGTDTARADFMNIVADFEYYDNDSVQILKLPYKGDRLSMLIFLPSERDGMSSFEQMITPGIIKEWKEQMFSTEVQVSIPKIEVRTHYDLKEPLGNLGVLDAFDPYTASLSGIANLTKTGNLYVDKAVHDAYLKINEEGTEAAAVTSIIVRDLSLPVREEFVADHPFLFVIQDDESDTFLFIGKILNPQK